MEIKSHVITKSSLHLRRRLILEARHASQTQPLGHCSSSMHDRWYWGTSGKNMIKESRQLTQHVSQPAWLHSATSSVSPRPPRATTSPHRHSASFLRSLDFRFRLNCTSGVLERPKSVGEVDGLGTSLASGNGIFSCCLYGQSLGLDLRSLCLLNPLPCHTPRHPSQ